jgi:hypothetical protein
VNNKTRRQIFELANARRFGITEEKGPEYSGAGSNYSADDADCLANFKNVAARIGSNPITVLGVYMLKHIDSVNTFIKELERVENLEQALDLVYAGEGIVSRLDDARNYLDILESLLWEFGLHPTLHEITDEAGMATGEETARIIPISPAPPPVSTEFAPMTEEEIEAQAAPELAPFKGSHSLDD